MTLVVRTRELPRGVSPYYRLGGKVSEEVLVMYTGSLCAQCLSNDVAGYSETARGS